MPPPAEIQARIDGFKANLRGSNTQLMIERHLIFGSTFALEDDRYFKLKVEVAERFEVNPPEIIMVGSGKLGFSIAPEKMYREFGETSDLDLAIVSPALFDQYWDAAFKHRLDVGDWPRAGKFFYYLSRGWIRPDMLPPTASFKMADRWWEFFRGLEVKGAYGKIKIRAGLYRNWKFLHAYQRQAVDGCRLALEAPNEDNGQQPEVENAAVGNPEPNANPEAGIPAPPGLGE